MNTSLRALGLVALTASISIIAGCGGSTVSTGTKAVVLAGGVTTTTKTDTPAIPASTGTGTPTTYTTTIGGVSKTVSIAASTDAFAAGSPIAVLPDQTPIFSGSFGSRAPGDVEITYFSKKGSGTIKTKFSNILSTVNGNIVLTRPIGLVKGTYRATVEGPVYFKGNGGATLTVDSIGLNFDVNSSGLCSMPTKITGSLPPNGTSTAESGIQVTVEGNHLNGGSATLYIDWRDGTSLMSATYDANNQSKFYSPNGGFTVPSTGITTVEFWSTFSGA